MEIAGTKLGANLNNTHDKYADKLAVANREVYAQFLMRIYYEIPKCRIAVFSKIKALQGSNFSVFRSHFQAKLDRIFLAPADTFDNVSGKFPIGFQIYNCDEIEVFSGTTADVYDRTGAFVGHKEIYLPVKESYFSKWVTSFKTTNGVLLGWFDRCTYNDFQNQKLLNIQNDKPINNTQPRGAYITSENLLPFSVAFGVRLCISSDWRPIPLSQRRLEERQGISDGLPDIHAVSRAEQNFIATRHQPLDSLHPRAGGLPQDLQIDVYGGLS